MSVENKPSSVTVGELNPQNSEGDVKWWGEKTPQEFRLDFREEYKTCFQGDMPRPEEGKTIEDGTVTKVSAYELPQDRRLITNFLLRAAQGRMEVLASVPFPESQNGSSLILFIIGDPSTDAKPSSANPDAATTEQTMKQQRHASLSDIPAPKYGPLNYQRGLGIAQTEQKKP